MADVFTSVRVNTEGVALLVAAVMLHPVEGEIVTLVEGCDPMKTAADGVMVIALPAASAEPDVYLITRGAAG